ESRILRSASTAHKGPDPAVGALVVLRHLHTRNGRCRDSGGGSEPLTAEARARHGGADPGGPRRWRSSVAGLDLAGGKLGLVLARHRAGDGAVAIVPVVLGEPAGDLGVARTGPGVAVLVLADLVVVQLGELLPLVDEGVADHLFMVGLGARGQIGGEVLLAALVLRS